MDLHNGVSTSSELEVDEGLYNIVLELDDDLKCNENPEYPSEGGQYLCFL